MKRKFALITAILLAVNLSALPCGAEEAQKSAVENEHTDRYESYLDAVRAQRRSRMEERSRAMREAAENRRRVLDPWGESRRQALENRTKWYQDSLNERRRWSSPQTEMLQVPQQQAREAQSTMQREQLEQPWEDWPPAPRPAPRYWNNPWYYQGY